ncbi:MAG TPA: hypothetical protein VFO54_11805, partial [Chryseosolibacter sp.]|nr:hypothetical protein [Chryseosolibacter sp.]
VYAGNITGNLLILVPTHFMRYPLSVHFRLRQTHAPCSCSYSSSGRHSFGNQTDGGNRQRFHGCESVPDLLEQKAEHAMPGKSY